MPRRPPLGLVALVAVVAIAGCSGGGNPSDAVQVTPVNGLSAKTLLSCTDLQGQLPKSLAAGVRRRPAVPASATTTAYGTDPALVLRCGVHEGAPLDEPYTFDGVRWAMHDTGTTRTWTTRGLRVNLEVVIPDRFDAQAELLGTLAAPIRSALSS